MTLEVFLRCDMFVLHKIFQPLSEHIDRLTGMNCFRLACQFLMCGMSLFVLRAIYVVYEWHRSGLYSNTYVTITMLITPLLVFFWQRIYSQSERAARRVEQGHYDVPLPLFMTYQPYRLFCLLVLPIDLVTFSFEPWFLLGFVQDVVLTSGLYFLSCLPRPPRRYFSTSFSPA